MYVICSNKLIQNEGESLCQFAGTVYYNTIFHFHAYYNIPTFGLKLTF